MNSIEKKIQNILNSLDNIQRASPKPFLYTRISMRLNYKKPGVWDQIVNRATNPRMAYSLILVTIVVNLVLVTLLDNGNVEKTNYSTSKFSTEYDIAISGFYDVENNDSNEGE